MSRRCERCDGLAPETSSGYEPEHGIEDCVRSIGARMESIRKALCEAGDTSSLVALLKNAMDERRWW